MFDENLKGPRMASKTDVLNAISGALEESLRCHSMRKTNGHVILPDGIYQYSLQITESTNREVHIIGSGPCVRIEEAVELVMEKSSLARVQAKVSLLIAARKSNSQIAEQLGLSPHTARRHTEAIMKKLRQSERSDIAEKLIQLMYRED
jgi:DNA-binding CsgD family transcriptional regulator